MPGIGYNGVAVEFLVAWGCSPVIGEGGNSLCVRAGEQQAFAELYSSAG